MADPLSHNSERFLRALEEKDMIGARRELEKLVAESAEDDSRTEALWGDIRSLPDDALRSAVGILLELIRLRVRKWPTLGAIRQLEGILEAEEDGGAEILCKTERIRAEKLLVTYVMRHPRDVEGSSAALETLAAHLGPRKIYRRALKIYATKKVFAPELKRRYEELEKSPD